MGKVILSPGADPKEVAQRLRKKGFVMKQQLPDGSFVINKKPPKKRKKHGQAKNLQDCDNGSDRSPQLSGDSLGFELLQRHQDHHDAEPVLPTR